MKIKTNQSFIHHKTLHFFYSILISLDDPAMLLALGFELLRHFQNMRIKIESKSHLKYSQHIESKQKH